MTHLYRFPLLVMTICAVLFPRATAAQQPGRTSEPLQIETIHSGWVIAPDAKFTTINDDFATLAGAYGGWVTDDTLLIGGGAYWLANREHGFEVQYGGAIGRWTIGAHRRLGVTAGALVGLGDATLTRTFGDLVGDRLNVSESTLRNLRGWHGSLLTAATPVLVSDNFFVTEPQVSALWRLTGWLRLDAGVSYRVVGGADLLDDQLRGVSGRVALQFGR